MDNKYKRVKYACYTANVCMSAVIILPPMLFTTFKDLYNISYTLLGLLVVVNFCTQLIVDLVMSFFSHKFNIEKTVKAIPVIAAIGFAMYALSPLVFKNNIYVGLVISTIVFSASSGLAEVLISPVIAAIPAKDPDKEMSNLHSFYAWGVVFVVLFSTAFLQLFGMQNWQILVLFFTLLPCIAFFLFFGTKLPKMHTQKKTSGALKLFLNKGMLLCLLCIFLGGASENIISQWGSSYIEKSLLLPKFLGDILGVALFATALGIGRSLYASRGKNIYSTIFRGSIGVTVLYALAIFVDVPVLGALFCALTGFFVAMMWPGSLIIASDKFPKGGVALFALMAAGGDLGSSVGPQLVGLVTDIAIKSPTIEAIATNLNYTPEQVAIKAGLAVGMLFPASSIIVYGFLYSHNKKKHTQNSASDSAT